ncbi:hypothetical protein ACSQ67_006557 [Phaseolus vulgaris]
MRKSISLFSNDNWVHCYVYDGTSVISLYNRSALLSDAHHIFEEIPVSSWASIIAGDVITWNTMISGYAQQHFNSLGICMQELVGGIRCVRRKKCLAFAMLTPLLGIYMISSIVMRGN